MDEQPSFFEVVFFLDETQYRYGFTATQQQVLSEWLYYIPTKREARLFERERNGEREHFSLSSKFREGRGLEERTRSNALFLSVVAQFNGSLAMRILGWFRAHWRIVSVSARNHREYRMFTAQHLKPEGVYRQKIIHLIRQVDLSIDDIAITEIPITPDSAIYQMLTDIFREPNFDELKLVEFTTQHTKYDADNHVVGQEHFDLDAQESSGTQKFVFLSGPLVDTLET